MQETDQVRSRWSCCLLWLGISVGLAAMAFGYGWMTLENRDRWVPRIEILHPRAVQLMTLLTERSDELLRAPRSDDL